MPLKLEDFAGSTIEAQAALIIDLDDWLGKRKADPKEVCSALGVLLGMRAARAGIPKAIALDLARMSVVTGAVMEILEALGKK